MSPCEIAPLSSILFKAVRLSIPSRFPQQELGNMGLIVFEKGENHGLAFTPISIGLSYHV
jgi:hypothetical protein